MMKDRTSCRVVRAVFAAGLAGLLSFAAFGNVIRVVPGGAGDGGSLVNEPEPNGGRVNLGAYGNTPWATLSPYGFLLMVK